jgi:hypothetical protein
MSQAFSLITYQNSCDEEFIYSSYGHILKYRDGKYPAHAVNMLIKLADEQSVTSAIIALAEYYDDNVTGVVGSAQDRCKLERLCRYIARSRVSERSLVITT